MMLTPRSRRARLAGLSTLALLAAGLGLWFVESLPDPVTRASQGAAHSSPGQTSMSHPDHGPPEGLLTVAERTAFRRTARHQDVITLVAALAGLDERATTVPLGQSGEARPLPLLVLADPPVHTPEQARAQGKALVFVFANIHAGEVCGKEAVLMLAREWLLEASGETLAGLLDELVVVFAPIYNADGNDAMAPDNRPGQIGPEVMGTRGNARGRDLNRDYIKAEERETQAMLRFLDAWDPHLIVDLHTTNGSLHRYDLTYAPPLNPEGPAAPLELVRDRLLPDVRRSLAERTGRETFLYGNFDADRTRWSTYSSHPRFGAQYHGLRGHASVLSEAYSYIDFEQRVLVTREFVREICHWAAAHADALREAVARGKAQVREAVAQAAPLGLRHERRAADEPATILSWSARLTEHGAPEDRGEPVDLQVLHEDHFEAVLSVPRPAGYVLPAECAPVVDVLRRHGIAVHTVGDSAAGAAGSWPREVSVERWTIQAIARADEAFQGHRLTSVEAERAEVEVDVASDAFVVPLDQDLGTLAAWLLEPLSEDGLVTWQVFDPWLAEGAAFPALRVTNRSSGLLRR